MTERIPICLVVGDDSMLDTLARKYEPDAGLLLRKCRRTAKKHARISSQDPRVVYAFQALHALGEIELIIQRVRCGKVLEFRHDIKGEMISPWPDNFFEVEFYLRFHTPKEERDAVE